MSADQQRGRLACGHDVPEFGQIVSVPGVGEMCRTCHTPLPLSSWERVIRERTYSHRDGRVHHSTQLLGLDPVGRALYYDSKKGRVLLVVPKHHPDFHQDVEPGASPLRKYPPRHGPRQSALINGPSNDVLVAVGQYDSSTDITRFSTGSLPEWVVEHALAEDWKAIDPAVLGEIQEAIECYDQEMYADDAFPIEAGRDVLESYDRQTGHRL